MRSSCVRSNGYRSQTITRPDAFTAERRTSSSPEGDLDLGEARLHQQTRDLRPGPFLGILEDSRIAHGQLDLIHRLTPGVLFQILVEFTEDTGGTLHHLRP